MPRLPLAPPLLPDEALSSWLARIAARYDLDAHALVRHLLPTQTDITDVVRCFDRRATAPLEAALAEATGEPASGMAAHRLAGITTNPQAAWPRVHPAWCPLCVVDDVAAFGEVHSRPAWGWGGVLLCARHQCLLTSACPQCWQRAGYHPMHGRLRLWCWHCEAAVDTALAPSQVAFWPHGNPQQRRSCTAVSLSSKARPLLFRVQTDLIGMLAGARPRGPWARSLPVSRVFDVLRKLAFVMLGPLWEDTHQAVPVSRTVGGRWMLPEDWTPGSLPPEVAAPAMLAAVTFLAAESGTRLAGIGWNPQVLIAGESETINAETLLWHLNGFNARLVQDLFTTPFTRPFCLLFTALRADRDRLGVAREASRRRVGVGGLLRQQRQTALSRSCETEATREQRERRERRAQGYDPADRFSFSRLIDGYPAAHPPAKPRATWPEAVAVYSVIGWRPRDGDLLARTDWVPELLQNRYIRVWIIRHRHLPPETLIATLVNAVDAARAQDRGIVLPELSSVSGEPVTPARRRAEP